MENYIENKYQYFYSHYFAKYVFGNEFYGLKNRVGLKFQGLTDVNDHLLNNPICFLQLIPVEKISDEHAIEVANMLYPKLISKKIVRNDMSIIQFGNDGDFLRIHRNTYEIILECKRETRRIKNNYPIEVIDYLRSKGYYLGDGKELEYGWVKLIE